MRFFQAIFLVLTLISVVQAQKRYAPFVPLASTQGESEKDEIALPEGFAIGYGPLGLSLVWSPAVDSIKIFMGGARSEFRIAGTKSVFGYAREINNQLHLAITTEQKEFLAADGIKLEVWKSGKRLDVGSKSGVTPSSHDDSVSDDDAEDEGYESKLPNTPKINVNPAIRGSFRVRRLSYNLTSLPISPYPNSVEVVAEVYQPLNVTQSSPLVLFLHGRFFTCYRGLPSDFDFDVVWPCPDDYLPVPSYQGYRYIADTLATQGYLAVSISANGVNGQDFNDNDAGAGPRSKLIRHHLNLISTWNSAGGDPWGNVLLGKVNMNKVVLVGHSRGGEGIHRAAIDIVPSDPYKVVGIVTYGPTAFGQQVTPDIHSATILSTCDGDVYDLQGQAYVDRSRDIAYSQALRTAITVYGANHNFFNTESTPGISKSPSFDDWDYGVDPSDPVCGSTVKGSIRLTPLEQRIVGATYTAALVHLAVNQDMRMLPLLDGSFVRPTSIGRADVAVSAIGGAGHRLLYTPGSSNVRLRNGMSGFTCAGPTIFFFSNGPVPPCTFDAFSDFFGGVNSPHFTQFFGPPPLAYELEWTSKVGAIARFSLRSGTGNLTGINSIDLRIANDPNKPPANLKLVVSDSRGRNATLPLNLTTIDGWPGSFILDRLQARTFRGRVEAARLRTLVDISRITAISLVTRSVSGRVWLLDISASKRQIVQPAALNLPVVSIDNVVVQEGNKLGTVNLKVRITPPPTSPGVIWVLDLNRYEEYRVNITAGSSSVLRQIPISWTGNEVYNGDKTSADLAVVATRGVVTGNWIGGLTVVEDDPFPILSAVANNVTTVEGQFLRWTLKLSSLSAGSTYFFTAIPPRKSMELKTDDVDSNWLGFTSSTPVVLSEVGLFIEVNFAYGELTEDLVIPIVSDGKSESTETITLEMIPDFFDTPNPLQPKLILVGTVPAHA